MSNLLKTRASVMKPIDRPSSAGSHASVDSQDSSVSWLLSLEGERSHFGHKAIVIVWP